MSDDTTPNHVSVGPPGFAPVVWRRQVRPELADHVQRLTGYAENGLPPQESVEIASLIVPLVISFGEPFTIALGRSPTPDDRYGSFASGLYPGYVSIGSTGRAECIQVDFTPLGAFRFFGLPMRELASRMVTLDDLGDPDIAELRRRLGDETDWTRRFAMVEAFLHRRLRVGPQPCASVDQAFRAIMSRQGAVRVRDIASGLGWSRKHLNERFREQVGVGPKTLARIVRFNRAIAMARHGEPGGWAEIAAGCGYADQAHLAREFRALSGMTPTGVAAFMG